LFTNWVSIVSVTFRKEWVRPHLNMEDLKEPHLGYNHNCVSAEKKDHNYQRFWISLFDTYRHGKKLHFTATRTRLKNRLGAAFCPTWDRNHLHFTSVLTWSWNDVCSHQLKPCEFGQLLVAWYIHICPVVPKPEHNVPFWLYKEVHITAWIW